jgi:aspartyl/glutamyl-tRNA(Asn/Gln) amidotransferase C subunit
VDDKRETLRRMVREAYLTLSPAEEDALVEEVRGLLDNVELLAALPLEPYAGADAVPASEARADEVTPSLPADAALRSAPASHDGFVSVPKIIVTARAEEKPDDEG